MMPKENQNTRQPYIEERLKMLADAFPVGASVVAGRRGERIIKGTIHRIEGRNAFVRCPYMGNEIEEKVSLDKLSKLNPESRNKAEFKTFRDSISN